MFRGASGNSRRRSGDSIRPFSGRVDRRGQIEMLAEVADHARNIPRAMESLVTVTPQSMTASWAVVLDDTGEGTPVSRVAGSMAAATKSIPGVRSTAAARC